MEGSTGPGNLSAGWRGDTPPYPAWALALMLIVTIAGGILGNGFISISIPKDKKLRKAGEQPGLPRQQGGRDAPGPGTQRTCLADAAAGQGCTVCCWLHPAEPKLEVIS